MNNSFHATSLPQQQHKDVLNHAQQHHVPSIGSTTTSTPLLHSPPEAEAIGYLQHQSSLSQQQQQFANLGAGAAHSTTPTYFDPRQLQGGAVLDKSYYTGVAATPGRYFTTSSATNTANHPNTILITNNFTQQQLPTTQHQRAGVSGGVPTVGYNNNSIRIVSAASQAALQQHDSHQQHICNISNNIGKETQQLQVTDVLQVQHLPPTTAAQQQQLFQQQQLYQQPQHCITTHQQHLPTLLTQHFAQQHYATPQSTNAMHIQLSPPQHFYLPATDAGLVAGTGNSSSTVKLLPTSIAVGANTTSSAATAAIATTPVPTESVAPAVTAPTSSTVVLDRINICINNHYTDASSSTAACTSSGISSSSATTNSLPAQQPSPIIPAIQHKAIIDASSGLLIDPYASNESTTLVIDEPDSTTTTPHTPPATPENSSPTSTTSSGNNAATPQSPTTTTTSNTMKAAKHNFAAVVASSIEEEAALAQVTPVATVAGEHAKSAPAEHTPSQQQQQRQKVIVSEVVQLVEAAVLRPLTPPTPPSPTAVLPAAYSIGEDVFIQRQDGRFYLGTVIDTACGTQFLVRFDDKSELWCALNEMRKLGSGSEASEERQSQMCVACKRAQSSDVVEICERCGRGYHRNCTAETATGSGEWLCKRCSKPMKMLRASSNEVTKAAAVCRQLPYHVDTLNWDDKHRVNEEQIYCYCGKSGKFDHNMLQCCKCRNWFHTHCMQRFHSKILRGDGFFVFCCAVCNEGEEFLRRLQMNWVDLLHLTLYNLSVIKKHHKYHHLIKDIWPFVLERRSTLAIPKAWIEMPEAKLMDMLKSTLKENTDRFICGREIKKGHCYYALRNNGPPILPKFNVKSSDVLNNELLVHNLKLVLLKEASENNCPKVTSVANALKCSAATLKAQKLEAATQKDVYEFRIEDDDTTDDEIPIKDIIEKVRKSKNPHNADGISIRQKRSSSLDPIDVDDENANDGNGSSLHTTSNASPQKGEDKQTPKKRYLVTSMPTDIAREEAGAGKNADASVTTTAGSAAVATTLATTEKSSRKRKAFTLSKTYKEIAAEAAAKRYDRSRICDSSSDENSSSSRGTSLDLIIPPPKNFLGLNNPFRLVTPKKHCQDHNAVGSTFKKSVSFGRSGTMIKNSIFNTNALDFSSKLAALKSAGIFPNLSTSNLAKAAGQPRTVRTIKRRLSAKDITIGPNQEVRRRRTRRLSSNVEVISTTTINPIPSTFFPIHAKDLLSTSTTNNSMAITSRKVLYQQHTLTLLPPPACTSSSSSASSSPPASTTSSLDSIPITQTEAAVVKPMHGRRLRQRPQKNSPSNSRRSSISGANTNSSSSVVMAPTASSDIIMQDLKQSVNKYFGAVNRIESGEQFSIRAKRQLANGQMQYLIEWGDATASSSSSNNNTTAT